MDVEFMDFSFPEEYPSLRSEVSIKFSLQERNRIQEEFQKYGTGVKTFVCGDIFLLLLIGFHRNGAVGRVSHGLPNCVIRDGYDFDFQNH